MDDEDLADAEEAKKLQTSASFAGLGSTEDDAARQGALMDILKTGGETMGVKLLRKMGWRDGQGVGPKVRRKARLDDENKSEGADEREVHLFAPENSVMISFVRKYDQKGLGYEGEGRLSEVAKDDINKRSNGASSAHIEDPDDNDLIPSTPKKKKQPQARKSGFGVGILNDTGSDEEDPYQIGPQISYNRTIGGDKQKKKNKKSENVRPAMRSSNPLLNNKPVFISKKTATSKSNTSFRRCHDGRLPLDGFILSGNSSSDSTQINSYPPPTIPPHWKSSKNPTPTSASSQPYVSPADAARSSSLNPSTRANLLGETPLPGKSVFSYLTSSARSRIATATSNPNLPPALNEAPPPTHNLSSSRQSSDLASLIPTLDPATASAALGRGVAGWLPYADDPPKLARYRIFLETRASLREGLPDRAPGSSTTEWAAEMAEFAHAAQIFKPMTGMMASRFTSASASTPPAQSQNHAPDDKIDTLLSHPSAKPKDPAEEAARLGMFGPLTRSTSHFFPSRLLCKRFNVKAPTHVQGESAEGASGSGSGSGSAGPAAASSSTAGGEAGGRFASGGFQTQEGGRLQLVGKREMEQMMRERGEDELVERRGELAGSGERHDVPETKEMEKGKEPVLVDAARNEALEGERPGEAVFRAIFGSDSESESGGD